MKRILCIWLRGESQESRVESRESLAKWCEQFSPCVGLEQSDAPESLLLDVTGLAHLFGGEAALAEQIARKFADRGLTIRLAIADTVGAAWAVSRWGESRVESRESRVEGRDSSSGNLQCASCSVQSFSPGTSAGAKRIVPSGQNASALRGLPVEALRLPVQTVDLLHQLGIRRIGQLEAIPRDEFLSRFGPVLLRRWDQALGRLPEPIAAHQPPPEFVADRALEYPIARQEAVEAALEPLIAQLAAQLLASGQGALRLECRLNDLRIGVGLFQPTAAAKHLFELIQIQLEQLRLAAPVTAVRIHVTATAPLEYRQQELFPEENRTPSPRHLAGLVDRLSSRLGRQAVVGVRLVSEAQPELACRYDPLVGGPARRRASRVVPTELPPRPLRLLVRPIPLARADQLWDAVPGRFCLAGRRHQVAHAWGPERIETGWWRGRTAGRDYYRIETIDGRRFWLFRRLRDGRWFCHGMFE